MDPRVAAKIIGMDRTVADSGEGAGSTDPLGKHIQDMMQQIGKSFSVKQPGAGDLPPLLAKYSDTCVEPRRLNSYS